MASSYRPSDALDVAKRRISNMPIEQIGWRILDSASKYLWMAAPWRWTIGALPAVTVLATTQDYPIALPVDFLYAIDIYQTDSLGNPSRRLDVVPQLPPNGLIGAPSFVAITGVANTTGQLRLSPIPPALVPGTTQNLIGLYKKMSPVLLPSNIYTPGILVLDDEWFTVYEAAVLWATLTFAYDQRAGTAEMSGTQVKYTGQLAVVESGIQTMREREKLLIADAKPPEPKRDR